MLMLLTSSIVFVANAASAAPPAKPSVQAPSMTVGCLIEPDEVAEVGSQVIGVVERLYVERGDSVRAGQALLSLRSDVERANLRAAGTRAEVDADVLAAKAGYVGSSRVDLQACKLEYSIVSPK